MILQGVADGQITVAEAERLLEAMDEQPTAPVHSVRLRVIELATGRVRTDVRIPVEAVAVAARLGLGVDGLADVACDIPIEDLWQQISGGRSGPATAVDGEGGLQVEVSWE